MSPDKFLPGIFPVPPDPSGSAQTYAHSGSDDSNSESDNSEFWNAVFNGFSNGASIGSAGQAPSSFDDQAILNDLQLSDGVLSPFIRQALKSAGVPVDQYMNSVLDGSAFKVNGSGVPSSAIDYLNADLAQHYGMGRNSAYQEALSNTAYQRAVKDMKAAGLNPAAIFGNGRGSGASGSSSSGSGSGSTFSNTDKAAKAALSAVGALIGVLVSKNPSGAYVGSSIGSSLGDVFGNLT